MSELPKKKLPDQRDADQGGGGASDKKALTKAQELKAKYERIRYELEIIKEEHGEIFVFAPSGNLQVPTAFSPTTIPELYRAMYPVIFDTIKNVFYSYVPRTGLFTEASISVIKRDITKLTQQVGEALAEKEISPRGVLNIATRAKNPAVVAQALQTLKDTVSEQFTSNKEGFLHTRDSMVEVATWKEFVFSPKYRSRNATHIRFDRNAKCPRFMEFINSSMSPEDASVVQRAGGQTLSGKNESQSIIMIRGTGGGGKSTLVNLIRRIVGADNVAQLRSHLLEERFECESYIGKTTLMGIEVSSDFLNKPSAQIIKALTGGDFFSAEVKNRTQRVELEGCFNVWLTSNGHLKIRLQNDAAAWLRRCHIVDFTNPPPKEQINRFGDKLLDDPEEGPGILNWFIMGQQQLIKDGHVMKITDEQRARMQNLLDESKSVELFLEEAVVKGEGSLSSRQLHEAYLIYCAPHGWEPVSSGVFGSQLLRLMGRMFQSPQSGSVKDGSTTSRGYRGVRFRNLATYTEIQEAA